jgi:flagellar protein FliO/FliZ
MLKKLLSLFTLVCIFLVGAAETPPSPTPPSPVKKSEPSQPIRPEMEPKWGEPITEEVVAPPSYEGAFMKMLLTLLALLVLIFLTFWLFRRMSHGRFKAMNFNRDIKILERRPLSVKSILYLIEVKGKTLLVAESQLEVRPLTVVEEIPQED